MSTATQLATLVVVSGPDRGTQVPVGDEMVHVGRAADKQLILTDPEADEHVVSLCNRNGRFAIYALNDQVLIDENPVPPERWVWLPETTRIRLTRRTLLQFAIATTASAPDAAASQKSGLGKPEQTPAQRGKAASAKAAGSAKGTAGKPAGAKRAADAARPNVARFIVDQQGDTLVKLGEDGQLPELELLEGPQTKPSQQQKSGTNPVLIYGAVAFSFLFSLVLLLVDASPLSISDSERNLARQQITEFYGRPGDDLQPYQRLLREARLARSRRDFRAEQRKYRQILTLLNSEDYNTLRNPSSTATLTGDARSDERLRELIGTLLSR